MTFPERTAGEVLAATHRRWDLSGPLPVPRGGWMLCPICGGEPHPRFWRFHERSGQPTLPHRCDVSFKCCECAFVWIHGVALDAETWARAGRKVKRKIHWREALKLLEEG